jgi:hypothetical protein
LPLRKGQLLNPEAQNLSLDDINKLLNGETRTNTQATTIKTNKTKWKGVKKLLREIRTTRLGSKLFGGKFFGSKSNSQDNDDSCTLSEDDSASEDWEEVYPG